MSSQHSQGSRLSLCIHKQRGAPTTRAAGYGILHDYDTRKCAQLGNLAGGAVIQHVVTTLILAVAATLQRISCRVGTQPMHTIC
eukprot:scaffold383316_cov22-Prasinocladus_malaysianus.AAC.1